MKKFLWAALLALPFLAVSSRDAAAGGCCYEWSGCWRIKICFAGSMKCCKSPFCCDGDGGGAPGCCPSGGCCGSQVPGPWYTYWPSAANPYVQTSPYANPNWTYEMNFQTPAPIYPFWPQGSTPFAGSPSYGPQYSNLQPAGYYPSYWYGR